MEKIETTILRNLLFNNEYCRKVLPFIKPEYFENLHEKVVFEEICKFIVAYEELATKEVLLIETEKRTDITEDTYKTICDYVSKLDDGHADLEWVSDTTEKWCRDRAIYLALMESIKIADGQDEKKNRDAIPSITLSHCVGISCIGVPGANSWKKHYTRLLADFERVFVFADGDQAGTEFARSLARELPVTIVQLQEGEDVNSLYVKHGAGYLKDKAGIA